MLLAVGMLVVIIAGGMDMTVGRLAGLGAVVSGTLAQQSTYYIKFWPSLPENAIDRTNRCFHYHWYYLRSDHRSIISKLKVPAFLAGLGLQLIIYGGKPVVHAKKHRTTHSLLQDLKNPLQNLVQVLLLELTI